ncbi:hypothetical protein [Bradyrhizobium centrolobii]|uniref:hypothetical protein n=1 Tax=Bradyrhizobium centrolobii TaxID=1505087 RepID=UPI0007C477B4|nr:hypothetical protein [Bradyrhizobium centrolobii]
MVVVVIPLTVVETSLTMVLAELPPPPPVPELPPADCEDDAADVDDVSDVDEAADVDDDDGVAEEDVEAVDWDVAAAVVNEPIALIDMKTSPEGNLDGRGTDLCEPPFPFNAGHGGIRRQKRGKANMAM